MTVPEPIDIDKVDIVNRQFVGRQVNQVVITLPHFRLTPIEAAVHAAWLLAVSGVEKEDFDAIYQRVINS
jgi:hypothetical protein